MKKLTLEQAQAKATELENKGLLNGGAGFETKLDEAVYTGTAKGEFDVIEFTYKSGQNKGKAAFMTLGFVDHEGTEESMPVNKTDLHLFNEGADVTFEVKKDKNGYKRLSLVKGAVSDTNVNGADETDAIIAEMEKLEIEYKTATGTKKATIKKQLKVLEEKLEAVA